MTAGTKKVAKPQVGQTVQYTGHEGVPLAAIVTMTADTYNAERDPSGHAKPADENSVSLVIFRPNSSRSYSHRNVPLFGSPAYEALVEADEAYKTALAALPEAAKVAVEMGMTWYSTEEDGEVDVPELPAKVTVRHWSPVS